MLICNIWIPTWKLCTISKTMRLTTTTMLLNLSTMFCFRVPMDWNGLFVPKNLGLLAKNFPKSFQNIVFVLNIIAFIANVITHGVHVMDKPNGVSLVHQPTFIYLCDSFDKDATIPIFVHPFNSSMLNSITFNAPL